MIIVKLMGGMGNQMFQYAAGRKLAERHRTVLKLDLGFLLDRTPKENFVYRDYDLDVFNINAEFAQPYEISLFRSSMANSLPRLLRKFVHNKKHIKEHRDHHFNRKALNAPDNVYLDGYWQSEKYFADIEHIIRKEFEFELDSKCDAMAEKLRSVNAICVNVRRGDFVNNPIASHFHGVCTLDYYHQCEKIIADKVSNPHYFIFSDDIEWCMENLTFKHEFTFVTHDFAGKKYEHYLHLMTMCNHYVIPNSSFAWWAAWLNPNKDKIVIAPKKWFHDKLINTKDLVPESWIRV